MKSRLLGCCQRCTFSVLFETVWLTLLRRKSFLLTRTHRNTQIEKMLSETRRYWLDRLHIIVKMQHDKSPYHVRKTDTSVSENGSMYGRQISLDNRPPSMPDFNSLDLGFSFMFKIWFMILIFAKLTNKFRPQLRDLKSWNQ